MYSELSHGKEGKSHCIYGISSYAIIVTYKSSQSHYTRA